MPDRQGRPLPDGGYEGQEEEPKGRREFKLETIEYFYNPSGRAYRLTVNGMGRGLLYLTEDEYEWLKGRVEGVMEDG